MKIRNLLINMASRQIEIAIDANIGLMNNTTSNSNPIIIIDDDLDDIEIFQEGFKQLGIENEIMVFTDGNKFYDYISITNRKSFFIFL